MKSFREYIAEANPTVDKNRRNEALHVFNRMVSVLERLVKSKSTEFMRLRKPDRQPELVIDLGKFISDKRYEGLDIIFTSVSRSYNGAYGTQDGKPTIELAMMYGRKFRRPDYVMTNTSFDDMNGFTHTNAFVLNSKDPSNYEHLLSVLKERKTTVRDVFVHEFTHHLDTLRYKDQKYVDEPTYNEKLGYGKEYFNHPKELNAHTQEIILNIDEWFKTYYVSAVAMLKKNLVTKFNSAKNDDQFQDAVFLSVQLMNHHDMIDKYLTDKKYAITSIREKIPSAKTNFAKYLTQENSRKVLSRLYQYYDEVLSKRFALLKSNLEDLPPKLNNKEAMMYLKQYAPEPYKALKRLGMR
jgi:hypothetical protein